MEVVMMNIYYFVRCVAIAAKYAFMGDGSYQKFQRMSSHAAHELQRRAQFIPGWTNPSAEVLHVRAARVSCGGRRVPVALMLAIVCITGQEEMLDAAARARINFGINLRCNHDAQMYQVCRRFWT